MYNGVIFFLWLEVDSVGSWKDSRICDMLSVGSVMNNQITSSPAL